MKISRFEVKITEHTSCRTCPHRCTNFLNKMSYGCKLQQESGGRLWYDNEKKVFADCMFLPTVSPESENAQLRAEREETKALVKRHEDALENIRMILADKSISDTGCVLAIESAMKEGK